MEKALPGSFLPNLQTQLACLVHIVYHYVKQARLSPNDCVFAGPRFTVTSDMLCSLITSTAEGSRLDSTRFSLHSLRVGGLVSLFAANVPDHLKQLAGRWSDPRSFITYARATIQQYSLIAKSLNDHTLVTADHVTKFYA